MVEIRKKYDAKQTEIKYQKDNGLFNEDGSEMNEQQIEDFKKDVRVFMQKYEVDRKNVILIKGILRKVEGYDYRYPQQGKNLMMNESNNSEPTDRDNFEKM